MTGVGSSQDVPAGTFGAGRSRWLGSERNVRNAVRQELIGRQLERHLGRPPCDVLDVGAGQGAQSVRVARAGHRVLAVEPDAQMRATFEAALAAEPPDVADRVTLAEGGLGRLEAVTGGRRFDAVLLLGVLMYLPASGPAIGELAARVASGGVLAVAARTVTSAVWRPAARQDWPSARAALDELDAARAEGRDVRYENEIGAPARADWFEALVAAGAEAGLDLEAWYGVRVAVDLAELDPPPPSDPEEWAALLDVEERLGAVDPYRQLGQLAHLVFRRSAS